MSATEQVNLNLDGLVHPATIAALKSPRAERKRNLAALLTSPAPFVEMFPFLEPAYCEKLCRAADARGYRRDDDDPYSAPELSLAIDDEHVHDVAALFRGVLQPMVALAYRGFVVTHVHDCFVIRYSLDTQQGMGEHFDEWSDVSVAVALDDDFDGGGVYFPGLDWSTRGAPVGSAFMFPGKVTHLHRADPITRGVRHSMTWWLQQ